jgi:hypothetical protein
MNKHLLKNVIEMVIVAFIGIAMGVFMFMYVIMDAQSQIEKEVVECTVKGTLAPKYPEPISHLKKSVILECEEKNLLTDVINGDRIKILISKEEE